MKQYFFHFSCRKPANQKTGNLMRIRSLSLSALMLIFAFGAAKTQAQTSNEFFATSYTGAIPSGPTASSQTARLLLNSNNPAGDTIGATNINVSVTASLSNQQFTGVGTGTGNPVVMFGATNGGGTGGPATVPVFGLMNGVGGGVSGQFSNTPSGTAQGLNVAVNHAFDMYTSVRQFATGTPPATTARVYMADLTLTFSSPVTNPRVHFMGMGGTSGSLGFTSEFTLITPGLTLTKIQGNTDLVVSGTQINNGNATIDASCTTNAGCGTVTVNGSNITAVTFQVFIRGDGGSATWSSGTTHGGDRFLVSASLPESYNLSGNVFNDIDGPGTINGTGISMPNGVQLFATLVDPLDNTVLGSIPVNPDGTYTFNGIPGGGVNYRVEISTNQGTALAAAPARILPSGWVSVGENLGAGAGNDGIADRALAVTVGTVNVTNANFGISLAPSAANVSVSGRVLTADGRGIRNTVVILTDPKGVSRTVTTSTFGYYRFDEVPSGETYVLSVSSKRYQFESRIVAVQDEIANLDFIAQE
jgi:hypothetical protein